ncbi:hypothetical protein LDR44_004670 [Salmonella enterica]|nr:hypothetical protein [Salmonella enterica]EIE7706055.1 hypothetical protein [Salmonella enterica]EIN2108380.1 hypothetical protein [Salmonella enterica]EIO8764932.1 hypothetical protein [Salmonella enterica]
MMTADRIIRIMAVASCVAGMLTGCTQPPKSRVTPAVKSVTVAHVPGGMMSDSLDDTARLERCRRELDALKKINITVYEKRQREFDSVMSGAEIYTGVRGEISTFTQGAVDAYYRYRSDKLCADIANDVLNELANKR